MGRLPFALCAILLTCSAMDPAFAVNTRASPSQTTSDREDPGVSDTGDTPESPSSDTAEPDSRSGSGARSISDSNGDDHDESRGSSKRLPSWSLCNQSGAASVNAVIAWQDDGRWKSSGWRPLKTGTCLKLKGLPGRYVYFYASSETRAWGGKHDLCLRRSDGGVTKSAPCPPGSQSVPFRRVLLILPRTTLN